MVRSASANGTQQVVTQVVRGGSSALAGASAAMSRVEREIDSMWRDSIAVDDPEVSARLAELSHAVHRAARALDWRHREIG
jgi:hypothetical protein